MRWAGFVSIVVCLLVGCSSDSPAGAPRGTEDDGCTATLPSTSSPEGYTVTTISTGTLPLVFDMRPQPTRVCPGGTVVVQVKVTNTGNEGISGFSERVIMGCGSSTKLVVSQIGPIDIPATGSVETTATLTVPLFAPGNCDVFVYGYSDAAEITVAAPDI